MSQKVLIPPKKEALTVDWSSSLPRGENDLIDLDWPVRLCLPACLPALGSERSGGTKEEKRELRVDNPFIMNLVK